MLIVALPVLIAVGLLSLVALGVQGRPVFYRPTRAGRNGRAFRLNKIRTMIVTQDKDARVLGGDVSELITPLGRWLRRTRLDELPQFWNVLVGDMSLVGPRPPLERIAENYPDVYSLVLMDRPGITGLATAIVCGWEERMLADAPNAEACEALYCRRSVPRKARIDRIYRERKSVALDLYVLYLTAARLFPLPGRRASRVHADQLRPASRKSVEFGLTPARSRVVSPAGLSVKAARPPAE